MQVDAIYSVFYFIILIRTKTEYSDRLLAYDMAGEYSSNCDVNESTGGNQGTYSIVQFCQSNDKI